MKNAQPDIRGMTDCDLIALRDDLERQIEAMQCAIKHLSAAMKPIQKLLWKRLARAEALKEERQLVRAGQRIRGAVKRHRRRSEARS